MKTIITFISTLMILLASQPILASTLNASAGPSPTMVMKRLFTEASQKSAAIAPSHVKLLVERAQQYQNDCTRLALMKLPANINKKTGLDMNVPVREKYVGICVKKALSKDKELSFLISAQRNE